MEKIELKTEKNDKGYIAKCTVDGETLFTRPFPLVIDAINHLTNVVVEEKKKKGQVRDFDYKFVIPIP
jgi:hypothetical protein